MKRFLVPVLLFMLLITACSRAATPVKWGSLEVSLVREQTNPTHWTAVMEVRNPTNKTQLVHYNQAHKYTMYVLKDGKEILKAPFGAQTEPELLNVVEGTFAEHRVTWTYKDQDGNPVPKGKYQVKVSLNAETTGAKNGVTVGPVSVVVK